MTPLSALLVAPAAAGGLVAFGREGERTRADLRREVAALAARLAPCAGARVALHCHDAYAFAVGLLAVGQAGALAVLPPSRQPGALLRLAGDVAGFLLDGPDAPETLAGRPVWSPLERSGSAPGAAFLGSAPSAAFSGSAPGAELVPLEREAAWVELFTSGTTGEEKPVPKTVRHLEDEVRVLEARFGAALAGGARMLSTASPQHLYGLLFRVLWPLCAGRPFLRTPLLHPEELLPYMDEASRFALASTPVALRRLADRTELAARGARCGAVFSSGGPLEADVAQRVATALGAPPFEVYGSTETGGVAVRQQWHGDESWQALPEVETALDPGDGRLFVTSPFVSCGEPVAGGRTRLATGDRAEAADDGGFHLRGRVDRVVKIAEKRLSLPHMESRLREHPAVAEAALLLMDDGPGEPRVAAVVVPTAAGWALHEAGGRRALGRELAEHLARDFDRVLLPRAWRLVDALPRDAQGKTPVRALRALLSALPTRPERLAVQHEPGVVMVEWRLPADLAQLEGHVPGHPVVAAAARASASSSSLPRTPSASSRAAADAAKRARSEPAAVKIGVLIPCYEHGSTVGAVVEALASSGLPCLLVDDGSGPATREALEGLAKQHAFVELLRCPDNQGKGAALKLGYRAAAERGWDGAIQLDADGQHDPADVLRFARAMQSQPGTLILGVPVFDASVPRARLYARQLSRGLVWAACLSRVIPDPLCGFRGMPLAATLAVLDRVETGNRMQFEPEVAVRLVWAGVPVVTLPTHVVYLPGGLSHFSFSRDYPLLASLYLRLLAGMLPRAFTLRRAARARQAAAR